MIKRRKEVRNKCLGFAIATLSVMGSAWGARPLVVVNADPITVGRYELDGGVGLTSESDLQHMDFPFGLTVGFSPFLEGYMAWGGQFERRKRFDGGHDHVSGVRDLILSAKGLVLAPCPLGAHHALALTLSLPTADEERGLGSGRTDGDATWIVSRTLSDRAMVHFNLGLTRIGGPDPSLLHYGLAAEYLLYPSVQWVGEIFGERELTSDGSNVAQFNTGFRWILSERLTLDAAAGSKLTSDAPAFSATAGFTWALASGH